MRARRRAAATSDPAERWRPADALRAQLTPWRMPFQLPGSRCRLARGQAANHPPRRWNSAACEVPRQGGVTLLTHLDRCLMRPAWHCSSDFILPQVDTASHPANRANPFPAARLQSHPMTWSIIARDERDRTRRHCRGDPLLRGRRAGAAHPDRRRRRSPPRPSSIRSMGRRAWRCSQAGSAPTRWSPDSPRPTTGRHNRQLHVMDRDGPVRSLHRGGLHRLVRPRVTRRRSRLPATCWPGRAVLAETIRAYEAQRDPAVRAAPDRGDAGRRGRRRRQARQAVGGAADPRRRGLSRCYDLRVDDHADPLAELARLEAVARERWVHFRRQMPSRGTAPSGLTDRCELEALIARVDRGGLRVSAAPLLDSRGPARRLRGRPRPAHARPSTA